MLRRIFTGFFAIIIFLASIPVYALGPDPTVPGYIMERRVLSACSGDTNDWLSGYIETAPAAVTDAVTRLTAVLPGVSVDMAIVTSGTDSFSVKLLFTDAAVAYSSAVLSINSTNATWPFLDGYGEGTASNIYQYRTATYTGTVDDPEFVSLTAYSGNQQNQFLMSGSIYIRYAAPWYANISGSPSYPDSTCDGQVTVSSGYIAFDSPTIPPGPGFNGTVNFSLNPGNVLVFEKSGGFDGIDPLPVAGSSLPKSLGWLEKTWSTGVTFGPSFSYPSSSTNLTQNYMFWEKVPGTLNLWGQTTSGLGTIPIEGDNDYFWIVNPIGVYRNSQWVNNPPIRITFNPSDFDAVYLTPMINMDGMAYIPDASDPIYKKYKIEFDADNGDSSYTDTSTDTSVPSADANKPGGLNGYENVDDGAIGETVGGILGILQSGARAIESLVNGARSFFEALNAMYDWLPDDVQTILKAALFLVFAVGVIKVLH